jgi:hypothetical protein
MLAAIPGQLPAFPRGFPQQLGAYLRQQTRVVRAVDQLSHFRSLSILREWNERLRLGCRALVELHGIAVWVSYCNELAKRL